MFRISTSHQFSRGVEKSFIKAFEKFKADIMLVEVSLNSLRDDSLFEASLDLLINNKRYTFSVEAPNDDLYKEYQSVSFGETPDDDVIIAIISVVAQNNEVQRELKRIIG